MAEFGKVQSPVASVEFNGILEFRAGNTAHESGVFLVGGGQSLEVVAVTREAEVPLGLLAHYPALAAKVTGRIQGTSTRGVLEAASIDVVTTDPRVCAYSRQLGRSMLALYEAATSSSFAS